MKGWLLRGRRRGLLRWFLANLEINHALITESIAWQHLRNGPEDTDCSDLEPGITIVYSRYIKSLLEVLRGTSASSVARRAIGDQRLGSGKWDNYASNQTMKGWVMRGRRRGLIRWFLANLEINHALIPESIAWQSLRNGPDPPRRTGDTDCSKLGIGIVNSRYIKSLLEAQMRPPYPRLPVGQSGISEWAQESG